MKTLPFLLVCLLCLNLAFALEISEDYDSNVIIKEFGNSLNFTLDIKDAEPGVYNLYTLSDVSIEPRGTFIIGDESFQKEFSINPRESLDVDGYYTFTYTLNHRGFEKTDNKFTIKLVGLSDALEVYSNSIDPGSGQIKFYVKNKENVEIKNLKAEFSSILFEKELTFDLMPLEEHEIKVDVDKDRIKKTRSGVYVIDSTFNTPKGKVEIEGNLYLGEKKGIVTNEDASGLLIRTHTITKINSGNVLENIEIQMTKNIFSRLFTSFSQEPLIVDRNGFFVEYTWVKQRLGPSESFTIKAKTNYVLPFFVILFAILGILGFKRYSQTKLELTKTVTPVRTKGGEFALRIKISIKSKKGVENVTLVDKVPPIVKIYKKFSGALPSKIDPESRRVHWHIGDLNSGEERIFSYVVYSKVGVVGKFSLPSALAVFEHDGEIHEVESNKVFFMNEQAKE